MPTPRNDPSSYKRDYLDLFERALDGPVRLDFDDWKKARNFKDFLVAVRRSWRENPRKAPKPARRGEKGGKLGIEDVLGRVKVRWIGYEVRIEPYKTVKKVVQEEEPTR